MLSGGGGNAFYKYYRLFVSDIDSEVGLPAVIYLVVQLQLEL